MIEASIRTPSPVMNRAPASGLARAAHRILVSAPLHSAALSRLSSLFVVDWTDAAPIEEQLLDKTGIILAQNTPFPTGMLTRLRRLQAVSLTGRGQGRLDLDAMTSAGIRVTDSPLDDSALIARELWRRLERMLNERIAVPVADTPAPPGAALRRADTALAPRRPPARPVRLRFGDSGALSETMAGLAREAGLLDTGRSGTPRGENDAAGHRRASASTAGSTASLGQPPAMRIRVLLAPTDPAEVRGEEQLPMDLSADVVSLTSMEAIAALRDQLTVDGLIASLGIGRNSFHPRFLLNPDVCPMSCC